MHVWCVGGQGARVAERELDDRSQHNGQRGRQCDARGARRRIGRRFANLRFKFARFVELSSRSLETNSDKNEYIHVRTFYDPAGKKEVRTRSARSIAPTGLSLQTSPTIGSADEDGIAEVDDSPQMKVCVCSTPLFADACVCFDRSLFEVCWRRRRRPIRSSTLTRTLL